MNIIKTILKAASSGASRSLVQGFIPYGKMKKDGSHDHRYNCGDDRTPKPEGWRPQERQARLTLWAGCHRAAVGGGASSAKVAVQMPEKKTVKFLLGLITNSQ